MKNAAHKREQIDACISYAEREQYRNEVSIKNAAHCMLNTYFCFDVGPGIVVL